MPPLSRPVQGGLVPGPRIRLAGAVSSAGYVELHAHSFFSLLKGASSPEALVERAVALGYPALALTDHHGLYGAVRFWQASQRDCQVISPKLLGTDS